MTNSIRVETLVTHTRPHLDEGVAIWLLQEFGETLFPGVGKAQIVYVDAGTETYNGKTAEELEADGILMLGVGTGRFNEHPTTINDRKTEECTATLVAQALGVSEQKELEEILTYVLKNDTRGSTHKFELATMMTTMHSQGVDPKTVLAWLSLALKAKLKEQRHFWGETAREYERIARRERLSLPSGTEVTVVICESDNEQISRYARGIGEGSLVIMRTSTGHTQLLKHKRVGLPMAAIAAAIRSAEAQAQGVTIDYRELSREGKVEGADNWHFHEATGAILNGSLTALGIEPTRLSLPTIIRLAVDTLREGTFHRGESRHMAVSIEERTAVVS